MKQFKQILLHFDEVHKCRDCGKLVRNVGYRKQGMCLHGFQPIWICECCYRQRQSSDFKLDENGNFKSLPRMEQLKEDLIDSIEKKITEYQE